jgi:SlyX protein
VSERDELEARIVDLELRFMRQEKLAEELNDVLVEHERTIDRLVAELRTLRQQVGALGEPMKDEPPPHY